MKARILVALPIVLAIMSAGCSRDEQASAAPEGGRGSAQPAAESDDDKARSLSEPLPNGMALSFPYHLRRDRIEEVDPGVFQRRVRIEYIGLDKQEAVEAIKADHVAAGYRTGRVRQLENGRIRISFRHPNEDRTTVTVLDGVSVTHPSATGMVYIHIPVPAPAEPLDAQETTEDAADE